MALVDRWRWRGGSIEALDGLAAQCLSPICDLLEDQAVSELPGLENGLAWGQFLDRTHHSEQQWGRFGTSAAVQVFAMAHYWDEPDRSVYETSPLTMLAPVKANKHPNTKISTTL
jgi:hypothetical protein